MPWQSGFSISEEVERGGGGGATGELPPGSQSKLRKEISNHCESSTEVEKCPALRTILTYCLFSWYAALFNFLVRTHKCN